jgi:enoyl-CoA hydratase/carnithine racemase
VISLSKPPHNLMDEQLLQEIMAAYKVAIREGCRAILLRSDLRHFCVGADVAQFKNEWRGADKAGLVRLHMEMEDVAIPAVAAVKGAALGGGFELALWCDFIVATETSFMGLQSLRSV